MIKFYSKKLMSIFMVITLMILSISGVKAATTSTDNLWVYNKLTDTTIEITSYKGTDTTLNIPSKIDTFDVVKIADEAFYKNSRIIALVIPNTVTYIGERAFANCYNLRGISVPSSVSFIGDDAFASTPYLTLMTNTAIDGVTYINNIAISYDGSVSDVTLKAGTTDFGTIFQDNQSLVSLTLPSSVTSIGDFAFLGCSSLNSVIIPDSIYNISTSAFLGLNPKTFVIFSNSNSYARTYAIANGYNYSSIPTYPYLYNSYSSYDKYSASNLSMTVYIGDGMRALSSISSATIKNSSTYSGTVVDREINVTLAPGTTQYVRQIEINRSEFSDLAAGLYTLTFKTNTGYALTCTLNLTSVTPSGVVPSILSQTMTYDIYKAADTSFEVNLGTFNSKATAISEVKIDNTVLASTDYSLSLNTLKIYKSALSKLGVGTYKISVKFNDIFNTVVSDKVVLTVKDTTPTEIATTKLTLSKDFKYTSVGGYYTLKATVYPTNATDKTVEWTSSDESIVSVNDTGKVTAHKAGTAIITATTSGGQEKTCVFIVKNVPKASKASVTIKKGSSSSISLSNKYSWAVVSVKSSNSAVATATTSGKITAKKAGSATITWSINQCGKIYTTTTKVVVK